MVVQSLKVTPGSATASQSVMTWAFAALQGIAPFSTATFGSTWTPQLSLSYEPSRLYRALCADINEFVHAEVIWPVVAEHRIFVVVVTIEDLLDVRSAASLVLDNFGRHTSNPVVLVHDDLPILVGLLLVVPTPIFCSSRLALWSYAHCSSSGDSRVAHRGFRLPTRRSRFCPAVA